MNIKENIKTGIDWVKAHKREIVVGGLIVAGNTGAVLYIENQNQRISALEQRVEDDAMWGFNTAKTVGNLGYMSCLEWKREQWLHEKIVLLENGAAGDPPPLTQDATMECLILGFEAEEYLTHPNLDMIGSQK